MKNSFILLSAILLTACTAASTNSICSEQSQQIIEQHIGSSDGQGHGPDIGSDEWHGVIEFKLGIRGQADLPERHSQTWCDLVLNKIPTIKQF